MPRPKQLDPERVLDAVEELLAEGGRAAVTIRALGERAGASNGSIYHSFGSLDAVLGRAWLRRAEQFLALQRAAVDEALALDDPVRAVQAAADTTAVLAELVGETGHVTGVDPGALDYGASRVVDRPRLPIADI